MLIHKGAEANLYLEYWFGYHVIRKERISKKYRNPKLDAHLRKSRTKNEVKLLSTARSYGVPTPIVYYVDLSKCFFLMEYIDGILVRDLVDTADKKTLDNLAKLIAKNLVLLHNNNIIHSDLTTSNMILFKNLVYFLDFGLAYFSTDIEDKAVDLHLLKRTIESTHYKIGILFYERIIDYYKKYGVKKLNEILVRIKEIEERGRYVKKQRK